MPWIGRYCKTDSGHTPRCWTRWQSNLKDHAHEEFEARGVSSCMTLPLWFHNLLHAYCQVTVANPALAGMGGTVTTSWQKVASHEASHRIENSPLDSVDSNYKKLTVPSWCVNLQAGSVWIAARAEDVNPPEAPGEWECAFASSMLSRWWILSRFSNMSFISCMTVFPERMKIWKM